MSARESLDQIVRKLDRPLLAWGFYAIARSGDVLSTSIFIENSGQPTLFESNQGASYLMDNIGIHIGNGVHELFLTALSIGLYKFLSHIVDKSPADFQLTPQLVPYTIGSISLYMTFHNLFALYT
ncbi:MAG: hypothetical protein ABIH34_04225 [Nanoarchaeota archaeon]